MLCCVANLLEARVSHPLYFDPALPQPLTAHVGPGDMLYLPSMWYGWLGPEYPTRFLGVRLGPGMSG